MDILISMAPFAFASIFGNRTDFQRWSGHWRLQKPVSYFTATTTLHLWLVVGLHMRAQVETVGLRVQILMLFSQGTRSQTGRGILSTVYSPSPASAGGPGWQYQPQPLPSLIPTSLLVPSLHPHSELPALSSTHKDFFITTPSTI